MLTQNLHVTIIDYGAGNIKSVKNAFDHLKGCTTSIGATPADLEKAHCLILPGVAAFAEGMQLLKQHHLVEALQKQVIDKKKPMLGVCLGMQLLMEHSSEGGETQGLGWIPGYVQRFDLSSEYRVPHMGWNDITVTRSKTVFSGIERDKNFFFANSYHVVCKDQSSVIATCEYGYKFPVAVQKDHIVGMQFHPEKSHHNGLHVLQNFIAFAKERAA